MRQKRCVELFYPSSKYTINDIKKELSHKIKLYPKKKADVEITLNENGIYIVKISFMFEENLTIEEKLKFFKRKDSKKRRKPENQYLEKIDIHTKIKENMAIERYTTKKESKIKKRKSKYEIYMEKNIEVRPI